MMTSENLDLLLDEDLWEKMKRLKDGEEYDKESDTIEDLDLLSDDDLYKKIMKLKDDKDYMEECNTCGKPRILHVGVCIRSEKVIGETLEGIWRMFKDRIQPVLKKMRKNIIFFGHTPLWAK